MILQQYYTRERRGIFRATEGYDTIAKSPSLDKNLVKKVFHSYCFYDPPRELQVAGEKEGHKYPKSLMFIQLDTNETILGQSVYVPVDFTGQRSTFFTHNYLVPKDIREDFIKNPEKILYMDEFKESYDIEQGMELEAIGDLAYTRQNYSTNFANSLFEQIGITEELFKNLINAICVSIASRKKIYIALDVEAGEISTYSKKLLLCLLESLPYEIRRKVGFISYIQKPESKKGINIMFVDKESVRHGTSGADQDFTFDFSTKRFPSTKTSTESHPYLDFIWNNRGKTNSITPLYEFIDQVLSHGNLKALVDLATYDNLCVLYQIIAGNNDMYNQFKDQVFEYILRYLNEKNVREQVLLTTLGSNLIGKELGVVGNGGAGISIEFAKSLTPYYPFANQEDQGNISRLFLYSLLYGKNNAQETYSLELYEILQNSGALAKKVMSYILDNPKIKEMILNDYIKVSLNKIKRIDQWGKEVENLRNTSYTIIEEPYFRNESTEILLSLLDKQNNITSSGKKVYKILEQFKKTSSPGSRPSDKKYAEYIEGLVDTTVLKNISIKRVTKNDLINFSVSPNHNSDKVKILYGLKDLLILKGFNAERGMKDILSRASLVDRQDIQDAIKNLAMETPGDVTYEELVLAFYKEQTYNGEAYNYRELLTFIFTKKGKARVYNFILWSVEKEGFLNNSTKGFYKGYEAAIKNHFLKSDREAFKDKEIKEQFLNIRWVKIRRLFIGINQELATGFEKIGLKYGALIFEVTKYVVIIVVVGASITFGTIKVTQLVLDKKESSLEMQTHMQKLNKIKEENLSLAKEKGILELEKQKLETEKKTLEKTKEAPENSEINSQEADDPKTKDTEIEKTKTGKIDKTDESLLENEEAKIAQ